MYGETHNWTSLFDGQSLKGWTKRGGQASYRIENEAIIGTTKKGTPNTFLCTDRHYGDFILELEFKVDSKMNSGIQIRSNSFLDHNHGQVHGYQIEIDPSERAWSGGIYDEGRRGWLNPLSGNEAARKAFKNDEWNHYRIHAEGDHLRTWVNGVPAADLRDSHTLSGFIALQVHGTNRDEPMEVSWRNIRLKELGWHVWKPLFNGRDLSGWHTLPGGTWAVNEGVIQGKSPASEKKHGLLVSDQRYHDFTAQLDFKVNEGDSGFYFRVDEVASNVGVHGFQVEVDSSYETGGLYETGGRGWVVKHDANKERRQYQRGKWNTLTVSAHRRDTLVQLNGQKSAALTNDPGRTEGHLALQLHGGQVMDVEYKNIAILTPR